VRNYKIVWLSWVDEEHFVGVMNHSRWGDQSCYGWTKTGKSYFVYKIDNGQIEKLGTVKAEVLQGLDNQVGGTV
jgi:hypothetical protein